MALNNKRNKDDFVLIFKAKSSSSTLSNEDDRVIIEKEISELELPNRKDEDWKQTNLNQLLRHRFEFVSESTLEPSILKRFSIPNLDAYKLVFVNGNFIREYSDYQELENKIIITNSKTAKRDYNDVFVEYFGKTDEYKSNLFTHINKAYASDGAFIFVKENAEIDKHIHIINLCDGFDNKLASQYRNIIVAQANSKISIVNTYYSISVNYSFTNVVSEVFLGDNAKVNFNILQGEGNDASQINHTRVLQEKYSNFSSHTITLCGSLVHNDIFVEHLGESCETNLNGLYLPDREQHFDNNLFIHHAKPNCTSNQLYKGIVDNKASAVFLGKVLVDKGSQQTNANQTNRNVLLTDNAQVNSKPQLEIYADDVSCSHGSTTGQIDQNALFYLQSRGIERKEAETLLLNAFVSDVIDLVEPLEIKKILNLLVSRRLKGEMPGQDCSMIDVCQGCDPS